MAGSRRHRFLLAYVALCIFQAGHAIELLEGDTFTGMFELGGLTDDNYFVLRAHSPQHGAFTWLTGLGHAPGWMTHCTPPNACAGGPLTRPVFGTLNVTGVGECTDENSCSAPPTVQPGTGCSAYGCWNAQCGCTIGTGDGCWGRDMRNTIALIQRGNGVGEDAVSSCTFSRKIHYAELAGASAVIVFNNLPYAAVYMAADSSYTNLTIPAIFITREAGLLLWDMIQEAELHGGVDVSLTNQTENSLRLTIDRVSSSDGGQQRVSGVVEFRLEEFGLGLEEVDLEEMNITNNEMYPYGSFVVEGSYAANQLSLHPVCLGNPDRATGGCSPSQVMWKRRPQLLEEGLEGVVPFGLELEVRAPGADGVSFEHLRGSVVDLDGGVDLTAHVKMRRVADCQPEIAFVIDCMEAGEAEEDGTQCLSALDEKGYRNFNDANDNGLAPLFWYCKSKYCAGDYLTKAALKRLEVQSIPALPEPCPAGQQHGYVYLGPDDWGLDESLHLCGHGDRSRQPHVCRKLPANWYFNTTCQISDKPEQDCGHSGWFMEGGFIASCTGGADCSVDDSHSRLDLHIKLETKGQVAFTYTAHGEQFFDYMTFEVNDATVHHTQTWWTTGNYISGVVVGLPPGEHKLSWAWVKDWSLSDGDDKATLHEILVTGTPGDATCSDCAPGFCGNGGLRGCLVCPSNMKAADHGSKKCEPCGDSPEGTVYTGPDDWPASGNTDSCEWGCNEGFCSSTGGTSQCSSTTDCPPGQCCPHRGECYLPTLEMVQDGEWHITMEMLRNCLDLTPFSTDIASKTRDVLSGFLDESGLYPWYNSRVPGSNQRRGDLIDSALSKILRDANDPTSEAINQATQMPRLSDWDGLHGKLIKTMRDTLDPELAYVPTSFYQDISFFLPWQLHFKYVVGCEGWKGQCDQLHIEGMNAMVDKIAWGTGSGWYQRPCQCLTCSCNTRRQAEDYIGARVLQLDLDGKGLKDAVEVMRGWADQHAMGASAAARMVYALNSGERVVGLKGSSSMRHSAGQFGCSFATRNLGVCQLPTCTDDFCHIRMVLKRSNGEEETLDVPWTVVYHPHGVGEWDKAGEVVCTAAKAPPFDRNAACMEKHVNGRYRYGEREGLSGVVEPICHEGKVKKGGIEGRWYPVYTPAPSYNSDLASEQCAASWRLKIITSGMHTLGSPERAAAGMVMEDLGSMQRTAVIALRSFASEELALHNVMSEVAAASPDALLLDLRGNVGGELCHVFELAYLLSSRFASVQEAQESLALHLRHSKALDSTVYTDIVLGYDRGAGTGFGDACSLKLEDGKYQCQYRGSDLRWYYCGDTELCSLGRFPNCPPCPAVTSEAADEWTLPFRPRCSGKNGLLSFDPLSQCSGREDGAGYNILKTKKLCPACASDKCEGEGHCGFDKVGLTILTDGRCVGACAIFVELMEAADLATVVGPMMGKAADASSRAGALANTAKNWWCSLKRDEGAEATENPDLARFDQALPLLGQDLLFPLAAISFAAGDSKLKAKKVRQFPVSEEAARCPLDLYEEAMGAALVCGMNAKEDLDLIAAKEGVQNCSLPRALVAHRVCNASCPKPEALCAEAYEKSREEEAACQPKCWSVCSAVECAKGSLKVWEGSRYLCWEANNAMETWSAPFRLGQALGERHGWDKAQDHYGWRAKMSGGGVAALVLFLMALAGGIALLAAGGGFGGVSLPTLDGGTFNEGSPTLTKVKEGLGAAGSTVAAVGAVLLAAPVAAYQAIASRVQEYGGASGGVSDTINLASSTDVGTGGGAAKETSDYHAL